MLDKNVTVLAQVELIRKQCANSNSDALYINKV